ncbi:MAG: 30S ribosomal protein S4e [Sulfolobales archaeon]
MGGSRHLKSLAAPFFYPIHRKEYKWVVKPSPGPHSIYSSLPLLVVLRDVIGVVDTAREARRVISEGLVKVDGRVRRNYKYPVGFFDVITITTAKEHYRIIPYPTKFINYIRIEEEESWIKPLRVENKTTVKGGHVQLNLFGGYNVLLKTSDPRKKPEQDVYKTFDTIVVDLRDMSVKEHIPIQEGVLAVILGGRNIGRIGRIVKIVKGMRAYRTLVTLEDPNKHLFQTTLDYVYVIGRDRPVIRLS